MWMGVRVVRYSTALVRLVCREADRAERVQLHFDRRAHRGVWWVTALKRARNSRQRVKGAHSMRPLPFKCWRTPQLALQLLASLCAVRCPQAQPMPMPMPPLTPLATTVQPQREATRPTRVWSLKRIYDAIAQVGTPFPHPTRGCIRSLCTHPIA